MSAALLAGRTAFALRRVVAPRSRVVQVQAVNTKLEKPQRLWEIGAETWVPGSTPPAYLDASLPGDRGFDPLRLGEKVTFGGKPGDGLAWVLEGELYNGRLAMIAVVGILGAEALGKGAWYEASAPSFLPYWPAVVVVHLIVASIEWTRFQNFKTKGETGLGPFVPFDPLSLVDDYKRQSEIRNGRLAMLANVGFWSQLAVTGKSPLQNLADHLANPTANNILATAAGQKVATDIAVVGAVLFALEAYSSSQKSAPKTA